MPREYYDRGLPPGPTLMPCSKPMQDAYWLLRSRLSSAIAEHWDGVKAVHPDIAHASAALNTYVKVHSTHSFRIFRPEDAGLEHDHASKAAFLR